MQSNITMEKHRALPALQLARSPWAMEKHGLKGVVSRRDQVIWLGISRDFSRFQQVSAIPNWKSLVDYPVVCLVLSVVSHVVSHVSHGAYMAGANATCDIATLRHDIEDIAF